MEKITADEIRCEFFKMLCEAPEDIQMKYINLIGKYLDLLRSKYYLDLISKYDKLKLTKDDWIIFSYMLAVDLNKNYKKFLQ